MKPVMHEITGTEEEAVTMLGLYQLMPVLVSEAKANPRLPKGEIICGLMHGGRGWVLALTVSERGKPSRPLLTFAGKTPLEVLKQLVAYRAEQAQQANKPSNN